MKFEEIKPFIRSGSYEVQVGLRYLERTVEQYIEEGLELNPDFQRGHVWTEEQQVAFVEYLLREGRSGLVVYFNHPNWSTGGDCGKVGFVCVDGLQRITACLKFLRDEIKVFGHYYSEYEDKPSPMTGLKFNINELSTRKEVLEWYLQLNSGGTVHTEEELERVRRLKDKE